MAVMTTLSNDGVVETQPVPSSEKMALDLDINGTTSRDETNLEFEISKPTVISNFEAQPKNVPEIHRTQNNEAVVANDRIMEDFAVATSTPVNVNEIQDVAYIDASATMNPNTTMEATTIDSTDLPADQDTVGDVWGDPVTNPDTTTDAPLETAQLSPVQIEQGDSSFEARPAATTILPLVEPQESDIRDATLPTTQAEGAEIQAAKHEMDLHADEELANGLDITAGNDAIERSVNGEPTDATSLQSANLQIENTSAGPSTQSPTHPTGADSHQTHNIENLQIEASVQQAQEQSLEPTAASSTEPATDVQMIDAENAKPDTDMDDLFGEAAAPMSSGSKVARGREEDEDVDMDAPEAKRFKGAESSINGGDVNDDHTGDADGDRPITDAMKKILKASIQGVKKLKAGKNFAGPVVELWPTLKDSYLAKVPNPMDLTQLDRKLMANQYPTLRDYKADIHLIYSNCVLFNGAVHDITAQALVTEKYLLDKIPSANVVLPAPRAPAGRGGTPRPAAPPRRPSRPQTSPPQPKTPVEPQRRDSNLLDRPKRDTHPPKPKDFYHTPAVTATKTNRKKHALELKFCEHILADVGKAKNYTMNQFFAEPVDVVALGIPQYLNIIKKPMDLATMKQKLVDGRYTSAKDFEADFRLMLNNCFTFNPPDNMVHQKGRDLERYFEKEWAGRQKWMNANAGPAPRNSGADSGDEEEERSDEEEEEDGPVPTMAERNTLSNRVVEEQDKLIKLTISKGTADEIALQGSIVDMCKQALKNMDEKMANAAKNRKKTKAPAKAPKKASAPAPKKPKKPAKTRHISHAEKEIISQGIASLDDKSMQTVITWIRADVDGLAEVEDNELELDIDAVSNACLLRLFELVTTKIPGIADHLIEPAEPVYQPVPVAKPKKKNKPMGKSEQERKIAQLQQVLGAAGSSGSAPTATAAQRYGDSGPAIEHEPEEESSGDDDSESEED